MEKPRLKRKNPLRNRPRRSTQRVQSQPALQLMTLMTHCSSALPISRNDEQGIAYRICVESVINFLVCSDGPKPYFSKHFTQSWPPSALLLSSDDDLFAITAFKVVPGGNGRPNRSVQLRNAVSVNFNRPPSRKMSPSINRTRHQHSGDF